MIDTFFVPDDKYRVADIVRVRFSFPLGFPTGSIRSIVIEITIFGKTRKSGKIAKFPK